MGSLHKTRVLILASAICLLTGCSYQVFISHQGESNPQIVLTDSQSVYQGIEYVSVRTNSMFRKRIEITSIDSNFCHPPRQFFETIWVGRRPVQFNVNSWFYSCDTGKVVCRKIIALSRKHKQDLAIYHYVEHKSTFEKTIADQVNLSEAIDVGECTYYLDRYNAHYHFPIPILSWNYYHHTPVQSLPDSIKLIFQANHENIADSIKNNLDHKMLNTFKKVTLQLRNSTNWYINESITYDIDTFEINRAYNFNVSIIKYRKKVFRPEECEISVIYQLNDSQVFQPKISTKFSIND